MIVTHRRQFLKASAAGLLSASSFARAFGANGTLRAAVIGFRGRGGQLLEDLRSQPGVRIVALCDVDRSVLTAKANEFAKRGEAVECYVDARHVFDRTDIDLIVTATPNHWHSLLGIWACQSGKDAYIEKPISHDVHEGRKLVEAARKYGRIVQGGTQCRSSDGIAQGIELLRSGALGKIKVARGFCYKPRQSIGKVTGPKDPPKEVEYDLWCGPAPNQPLMRSNLHYDWHWVYDTGNGDLGNQGVHQVDLCRWALGVSGPPKRVCSFGGRFGYDDDGETANTQVVYAEYESAPLVFEVRGLPKNKAAQAGDWFAGMDDVRSVRVGCVIECEGGSIVIPDYSTAIVFDAAGTETKRFRGNQDHMANFIGAVRSRKQGDLRAEAYEGHLSAAICHYGNASIRLANKDAASANEAAVRALAPATEALDRTLAHLAANEVDLAAKPMAYGPWLEVDKDTEMCPGRPESGALLKRAGRGRFVIPDPV